MRHITLVALGAGLTAAQTCLDTTTVTQLTFRGATTVDSNLGGAGGRAGAYTPALPGGTSPTPQRIYMSNVGFAKTSNAANGHALDISVTTTNEYVAANADLNGGIDSDTGDFMVVNVKNPQTDGVWHVDLNFVDLTVTIIDQVTGSPLDVSGGFETWLTLYDFDELAPNPGRRGTECTQSIPNNAGTLSIYREASTDTELLTMAQITAIVDGDSTYSAPQKPTATGDWAAANVICSLSRGIGDDNPIDAVSLTTLQKSRSVYMKIENTNSITVRSMTRGCCAGNGRNFMFGGRGNLEPCPAPPPPGAIASPPPSPPPPSPSPPPVVAVSFDPHLVFAHGGKADFRGVDRTWYNLLSAKNVSLNAFFTDDDFKLQRPQKQLVHGSRMEKLCMTVRTNTSRIITIEYNATDKFPFIALVHQRSEPAHHLMRLTTDKKFARTFEVDNVKLSMRVKKVGLVANSGHGTTLTINTGKWEVAATSKGFANPRAHPGKSLLNIRLHALYDADHDVVAPHGLIGQSYDGDNLKVDGKQDDYTGDEVTTKAMAEGAIEGVAADYAMNSRFNTHFKYSRFDATAAAPRDVSKLTGAKAKATAEAGGEVGASADVEDEESKIETDVVEA